MNFPKKTQQPIRILVGHLNGHVPVAILAVRPISSLAERSNPVPGRTPWERGAMRVPTVLGHSSKKAG